MSSPPPPPPSVQRGFPLARLSTVRTGGPAELFARVGGTTRLLELLAWAHAARVPVAVVGSGSNLLIADEGVAGLVLKLEGELAGIERAGERVIQCGGGARLPAVAAYAARVGLSGIEFGVNIPGTVGGALRMNANAYGGELAQTLEWVEVAGERGIERRTPPDLGFAYRSSNLRDGEVVARASFALHPAPPAQVKATLAELRARRHEAQPQGIKTFGSTFKNPEGGVGPAAKGRVARVGARRACCSPRPAATVSPSAVPASHPSTPTSSRTSELPPLRRSSP